MRPRLLVGLASAIIVLATVLVSLTLTVSGPSTPSRAAGSTPPTLVVPASSACPAGAQQCSPVAPPGGSGATNSIAMMGVLVVPVLTEPGRVRRHRPPRSGRLAAGVVPSLLHPPRVVLTTH